MKVVQIPEKRLRELVDAMLARLELDFEKQKSFRDPNFDGYRRVNYEVRLLVDAIENEPTP